MKRHAQNTSSDFFAQVASFPKRASLAAMGVLALSSAPAMERMDRDPFLGASLPTATRELVDRTIASRLARLGYRPEDRTFWEGIGWSPENPSETMLELLKTGLRPSELQEYSEVLGMPVGSHGFSLALPFYRAYGLSPAQLRQFGELKLSCSNEEDARTIIAYAGLPSDRSCAVWRRSLNTRFGLAARGLAGLPFDRLKAWSKHLQIGQCQAVIALDLAGFSPEDALLMNQGKGAHPPLAYAAEFLWGPEPDKALVVPALLKSLGAKGEVDLLDLLELRWKMKFSGGGKSGFFGQDFSHFRSSVEVLTAYRDRTSVIIKESPTPSVLAFASGDPEVAGSLAAYGLAEETAKAWLRALGGAPGNPVRIFAASDLGMSPDEIAPWREAFPSLAQDPALLFETALSFRARGMGVSDASRWSDVFGMPRVLFCANEISMLERMAFTPKEALSWHRLQGDFSWVLLADKIGLPRPAPELVLDYFRAAPELFARNNPSAYTRACALTPFLDAGYGPKELAFFVDSGRIRSLEDINPLAHSPLRRVLVSCLAESCLSQWLQTHSCTLQFGQRQADLASPEGRSFRSAIARRALGKPDFTSVDWGAEVAAYQGALNRFYGTIRKFDAGFCIMATPAEDPNGAFAVGARRSWSPAWFNDGAHFSDCSAGQSDAVAPKDFVEKVRAYAAANHGHRILVSVSLHGGYGGSASFSLGDFSARNFQDLARLPGVILVVYSCISGEKFRQDGVDIRTGNVFLSSDAAPAAAGASDSFLGAVDEPFEESWWRAMTQSVGADSLPAWFTDSTTGEVIEIGCRDPLPDSSGSRSA